jgi:hypothetical protein
MMVASKNSLGGNSTRPEVNDTQLEDVLLEKFDEYDCEQSRSR